VSELNNAIMDIILERATEDNIAITFSGKISKEQIKIKNRILQKEIRKKLGIEFNDKN